VIATKALALVTKSYVDVNEKSRKKSEKMLLESQIVLPEGRKKGIGGE
jgi:hypothetical protein